jgi:hypothetical protein
VISQEAALEQVKFAPTRGNLFEDPVLLYLLDDAPDYPAFAQKSKAN